MTTDTEDFLAHHGVLGMHWGKHLPGRGQGKNSDYSDQQRKRDKQIYGGRGVRKINKSLNRGNRISVARGDEKTRRDRVMGKNKYVRQVGKVVNVVGGVAIANVAVSALHKFSNSHAGAVFVSKIFGANSKGRAAFETGRSITGMLNTIQGRAVVSIGVAKVTDMLSGDLAVSANMRAHGYNPNRK